MTRTNRVHIMSRFELDEMVPNEIAAIAFIETLRWGDDRHCVRCGGRDRITPQEKFPGRYWCGHCRKYFTARTGTPMEYSNISVKQWIVAAHMMVTHRKGSSSLQLSREVGISQGGAWYLEQRLRHSVGTELDAIKILLGSVEVDEIYLGGIEANKHKSKRLNVGGGKGGKQAVPGFREREPGKTVLLLVTDATKATLQPTIKRLLAPTATLYTDEDRGYWGHGESFTHFSVNHSAGESVKIVTRKDKDLDENNRIKAHTNSIESVFALLRRGFNGTFHFRSRKHMLLYLNEFAFRLNDGNCGRATIDCLNSLFAMMAGKKVRLAALTA